MLVTEGNQILINKLLFLARGDIDLIMQAIRADNRLERIVEFIKLGGGHGQAGIAR